MVSQTIVPLNGIEDVESLEPSKQVYVLILDRACSSKCSALGYRANLIPLVLKGSILFTRVDSVWTDIFSVFVVKTSNDINIPIEPN